MYNGGKVCLIPEPDAVNEVCVTLVSLNTNMFQHVNVTRVSFKDKLYISSRDTNRVSSGDS